MKQCLFLVSLYTIAFGQSQDALNMNSNNLINQYRDRGIINHRNNRYKSNEKIEYIPVDQGLFTADLKKGNSNGYGENSYEPYYKNRDHSYDDYRDYDKVLGGYNRGYGGITGKGYNGHNTRSNLGHLYRFGNGGEAYKELSSTGKNRVDVTRKVKNNNAYGHGSGEAHSDGYNQKVGYKGNTRWSDENGYDQNYNKEEGYTELVADDYEKVNTHKGSVDHVKNEQQSRYKKNFEINHDTRYKNVYDEENHGGSYKGNEFQIAYDAMDVQGGYLNKKNEGKYSANAKDAAEGTGEAKRGGKYSGNDYIDYGEYSKDGGFEVETQPHYKSGMANAGYGAVPYRDDKEQDSQKRLYIKRYHDNDDYLKKEGSFSDDGSYRKYGAEYEGEDYWLKTAANKAQAEANEYANAKNAYDKGSYRDVNAKGYNKAAQYQGDYQDNNKHRKRDFSTKHQATAHEFGLVTPVVLKKEEYHAKYAGRDIKGGNNYQAKFGQYRDAEYMNERDANNHRKKYNGDSFAFGYSGEAVGEFYGGESATRIKQKREYATPADADFDDSGVHYGMPDNLPAKRHYDRNADMPYRYGYH